MLIGMFMIVATSDFALMLDRSSMLFNQTYVQGREAMSTLVTNVLPPLRDSHWGENY